MSVNIACVSEDMILFRYSQLNGADFTGFTDLRGLRGIRGPTPNLYHLYFSFIHMNMNMDLTITILVHKSQTAEFHCNVLLLLNAIFRYKENRNRVKKFNFFIRQPWRGWAEIGRQGRTKWRLLRGVRSKNGSWGEEPDAKTFQIWPPFSDLPPPPISSWGEVQPLQPPHLVRPCWQALLWRYDVPQISSPSVNTLCTAWWRRRRRLAKAELKAWS